MIPRTKTAFENYLAEDNKDGSGKANSYLRAIDLLSEMLEAAPYDFKDCIDIWSVDSAEHLIKLRALVLEEQKKQDTSPWMRDGIPVSYLRDGHCSAALTQLIEFLPQHQHAETVLDILHRHQGDESELAAKLNIDPTIPDGYVYNAQSKDGQDRIRKVKTRIGQRVFREVILDIYSNRCCVTGLDIRTVNRASHIIGWAERKDIRMDPRNGLCLSATYDAAFDKHLISLDDDYRMILSKDLKDHTSSASLQAYFLNKEGDAITLPTRYRPHTDYLAVHRAKGAF
jgi:putative restriction endonuclease